MLTKLTLSVLAGGALFAALATSAGAEDKKCTEGTLATGECVNPVLGMRMRSRALILAQPKFSYSAPAYLPEDDYDPAIPGAHILDLDRLTKARLFQF
jgi:hypothetical protein